MSHRSHLWSTSKMFEPRSCYASFLHPGIFMSGLYVPNRITQAIKVFRWGVGLWK